jgi:hypothetical protein
VSTYKSNMKAVGIRFHNARTRGLQAAAQVVVNAVVLGLRGGYTTGEWVTGMNTGSVVTFGPFRSPTGWRILVGTSVKDPPYPLFWEVGFMQRQVAWKNKQGKWVSPKYIKRGGELVLNPTKFVRKPVWEPAFSGSVDRQVAAFSRAFRRTFGSGVTVTAQLRPPIGEQVSEAAD